jgi:hypothetical protein
MSAKFLWINDWFDSLYGLGQEKDGILMESPNPKQRLEKEVLNEI